MLNRFDKSPVPEIPSICAFRHLYVLQRIHAAFVRNPRSQMRYQHASGTDQSLMAYPIPNPMMKTSDMSTDMQEDGKVKDGRKGKQFLEQKR